MGFNVDDFRPPEWDCVDGGNPFLAKAVEWDEYVGDCANNVEWLDWPDAKARAEIACARQQQRSYELDLLFRWYALPGRPD